MGATAKTTATSAERLRLVFTSDGVGVEVVSGVVSDGVGVGVVSGVVSDGVGVVVVSGVVRALMT